MCSFGVKCGIFGVKKRDFWVKRGVFSERKCVILG